MKNINTQIKLILNEIDKVLSTVDNNEVNELIEKIINSNTIITAGAGRVGMAIKGFAMRLGHLGFKCFNLGDTTLPSIGKKDLFIVASGSGETQTIFDLVKIAHENQTDIFLISGNPKSRMGKLASKTLTLKAPSKTKSIDGFESIQPMTTLNEQSLAILFDSITLQIMERTGENHDSMWNRHSNLE